MSWQPFRSRLRMKTDMHCGTLMLGFVARAFPYVPQHVPIFAAVPAAVEALALPQVPASYREMESLLLHGMRATPFFVLGEDGKPLFPWEKEARALLEADFVSSRYGVALDDPSRSAEQGRLFETEVLLAHRRGSMTATRLEGYVWLRERETARLRLDPQDGIAMKDGSVRVSWPSLLGRLSLGGDRTRNLGRLWPDAAWEPCGELWNGVGMDVCGEWPCLRLDAGEACPVAVAADEAFGGRGGFSVMTGRRFSGGAYVMDSGTPARDIGWRPDRAVLIELDGERCARVRAADA